MADLLTAIKSVRGQDQDSETNSDLTVVKSTLHADKDQTNSNTTPAVRAEEKTGHENKSLLQYVLSPEDFLHTLRSQPDLNQLLAVLKALNTHAFGPEFNIHAPGPLQAQIINVLISTIVPDFWPSLKGTHGRALLLCLSNVAGLNAVMAKLKLLNTEGTGNSSKGTQHVQRSRDLLEVVQALFRGNHVATKLFHNLQAAVPSKPKRDMIWKDLVNLLASGKVVSTIAQSQDRVNATSDATKSGHWLANGSKYSAWLGRNIARMVLADPERNTDEIFHTAALFLAKSLNLGYSNSLLQGLFRQFMPDLVSERLPKSQLRVLLRHMPNTATRTFLEHLMRWLSSILSPVHDRATPIAGESSRKEVWGLAALVTLVTGTDRRFFEILLSLLSDSVFSSTLSFQLRRACLTTVSASSSGIDDLQALIDKYMSTFNDTIFANHAPILQQESLAGMLLITAGYIHRQAPVALLMTARSSNHMQGVSNRLDSSNAKARWLGMVVATVISSLVDNEGAKMDFGTEDMQTEEAHWYMGLTNVDDNVGTLKEFHAVLQSQAQLSKSKKHHANDSQPEELPELNGKPLFGPPRPPVQTEVIGEKIAEVLDSDEDFDDDDLKPYAKPDSDPEDSDEDATLVNRNKPKPPVYIRDLMSMLRDDKNHDRFQLGIKHAASLIRRKSNFGREVKDHAEEIGVILCSLQDPFKIEDFNELKLQAMIAVLLSDVKTMAPWFSKQAFLGDYGIAQRCAILSALGLGGRELAGLKNEDELNPALSNTGFPSKRLPSHLHSIYAVDSSATMRLEAAIRDIEQAFIKPIALQAADQSTAHLNAVKVRTFSSRMEIERTKRKPAPNALASVFGETFFFPLANRYQQEIAAYGGSSVYTSVPFLLVTFVKTLALLLHASGPATAGLTEISNEFWDLLLSLRVTALSDISILQALLFSLLTLLEVNTDKQRIVHQHPKQLMETQQWVEMVFERMGGGASTSDNADEAKVQTLAAGVLVKTREVIEAYQKELVGFNM